VVSTREPGGTESAERIRDLLVRGEPGRWQPLAELCLVLAARTEHLHHVIRPALDRGAVVLCDRFADSTRVYQGLAGGLGLDLVETMQAPVLRGLEPELTFVLDLDPALGARRAQARGATGRFERKGMDYHRLVRDGFLEIARAAPQRCVVIDASGPVEAVHATILALALERLGR
jgi:dTMP kinase